MPGLSHPAVFLMLLLCGCNSLDHVQPVAVTVLNADTKAPITGAEVRIADPTARPGQTGTSAKTVTDGTVKLSVADEAVAGSAVDVTAAGFIAEVKELPPVEKPESSSNPFKRKERPVAQVVVEMYPEPRPVVELVVATGYHGLVKAVIQVGEPGAPVTPGQREFSFQVPANGTVTVNGSPILQHLVTPDFRAKYANGAAIPREAKDEEVGFRWIKSADRVQYFFVGTKGEAEDYKNSIEEASSGSHSGGNGGGRKGGGGGGGGRHGGGGMGGGGMGGGGMGGR
ncbi:hypothetical protein FRUB_05283 [Fimbriiglobus ruber]|uniref:Uncharacterized protein n=1 Tax=Fimbriiglobus ruber TaxID=1908690 RepID=A0A225DL25_9BACT|nr:hypothetical protein FRUB_05283 [Fimbriiglobus ruber]